MGGTESKETQDANPQGSSEVVEPLPEKSDGSCIDGGDNTNNKGECGTGEQLGGVEPKGTCGTDIDVEPKEKGSDITMPGTTEGELSGGKGDCTMPEIPQTGGDCGTGLSGSTGNSGGGGGMSMAGMTTMT